MVSTAWPLHALTHSHTRTRTHTHTHTSQVRSKVGRRSYRRLTHLLESPTKQCVVFSNEHHFETFVQREAGETRDQWQHRLER